MKYTVLLVIGTVTLLIGVGVFWFLNACQDDWCFYFQWQKIRATNSFAECAQRGFPIQESYPSVCRAGGKSFVNPNESVTPSQPEANITVSSPRLNDAVGLPLVIQGQARVFENMLNYRLIDADGTTLVEGSAYAKSPDVGLFGQYDVQVSYPQPKGATGMIEVFDYAAKDGSEIDKVSVPIRFAPVEAMTVQVFFGSQAKDPQSLYCDRSYVINRRIAKTSAPARAALEELLRGPTISDRAAGFFTSINDGVKVQRLVIQNGVAEVDLSRELQENLGGSCRVTAIRSQITNTLKQFSSVKEVTISVDGRTKDILQP